MTGQPILKNMLKLIGKPASAAMPAVTMFALDPIKVPIPPKSAPKQRAQARPSMLMPGTFSTRRMMTGIIVVVKGMLSTNAEATPATS